MFIEINSCTFNLKKTSIGTYLQNLLLVVSLHLRYNIHTHGHNHFPLPNLAYSSKEILINVMHLILSCRSGPRKCNSILLS